MLGGLLFGFLLRTVTVWFRDYGPSWDGVSLRGNGAIIFLLLAPVAVLAAEVVRLWRRAWLAVVVLPVAVFVVLGGV